MKPAPHGRQAIRRGPAGRPNGAARRGSDRGTIMAKKSAAPRFRKLSTAIGGGAVALICRAQATA